MQKNNLLVEILTEELPPLSQKSLAEVFAQNISESIHNLGLSKDINYEVFSTPRRLGVLVRDVSFQGAIEKKVIKLMPASIGFDDKGNLVPSGIYLIQFVSQDYTHQYKTVMIK